MTTVSTIALEGTPLATEGYNQEQIDKSTQDFLASDRYWCTPSQFQEAYPEATKTDSRELLRKGAKKANTPEGKRVATMTQLIDNLRWDGGKSLAWSKVQELLPNASKVEQILFFVETLSLFGRPTKGKLLDQVLEGWEGDDEFVIDVFKKVKANSSSLDEEIKSRIQEQDEIRELAKTLSYSKKLEAEDAVDEIEYEICLLEVVGYILRGDYSTAFSSLSSLYAREPSSDTAIRLISLIQLFRL